MEALTRRCTARLALAGLLIAMSPAPARSEPPARLEGRILDIDGMPARGFGVHLIGEDGREVERVETDAEGVFSFRDLPSGRYGLAVAEPSGLVAPIAGPPVRLSGGQLARRDLKLVRSDVATLQRATSPNYGIGVWWASLSTPAKAWIVVAIVVAAWFTYEALTDDDTESRASPA